MVKLHMLTCVSAAWTPLVHTHFLSKNNNRFLEGNSPYQHFHYQTSEDIKSLKAIRQNILHFFIESSPVVKDITQDLNVFVS